MLDKTLLAFTASLALSAPALAQDAYQSVVLKEHLVTEDHIISLSDLFEGVEDDTPLARAGTPGQTISLDPGYIRREAARLGYAWANAGHLQRVSIRRASVDVPLTALENLVASELYSRTGRSHEVTLSNGMSALHAPIGTVASPRLVSLDIEAGGGLFRAEVIAYENADPVTVSGRAESIVDVPVLTRPVARGDIISSTDIEWIRLRSDRVQAETVLDIASLDGLEARRALRPGEALREYDLVAPSIIERGETVSLTFRSGALVLTAQARALSDAAQGERIRFVNLQSNRTIEAVATAPGQARVGVATTGS